LTHFSFLLAQNLKIFQLFYLKAMKVCIKCLGIKGLQCLVFFLCCYEDKVFEWYSAFVIARERSERGNPALA